MRIPSGTKIDDSAYPLLQSLIAYIGVTSANGAGTGLTLVCADLVNHADYTNMVIKVLDGNAAGQLRYIVADAAGAVTVDTAFTDATGAVVQILAGTRFVILSTMAAPSTGTVIAWLSMLTDAVYLDVVDGNDGNSGLPGHPVLTFARAMVLMAANNTKKLVLVGNGTVTINVAFDYDLVGNGDYSIVVNTTDAVNFTNGLICRNLRNINTGALTIDGDLLSSGYVENSGGGDITIEGSVNINGDPGAATGYLNNTGGNDVVIAGKLRCNYVTNTDGNIYIFSDCQSYGSLTTTTGDILIGGNAHISGELSATTGDILIYGNLYVRHNTTVSGAGGLLHVYGNANLTGAVGATNAAAVITIDGFGYILGAITATGTITYRIDEQPPIDFWSLPQEEVSIPAAAADQALPDIVVTLPNGARVTRAIVMFKYRIVDNINAGANALAGAQEIQIRDDTPSAWIDAINFVDNQFTLAASTRESGDVSIGLIDVSGTVDGSDTYNLQWDEAVADLASINFNDIQVGLRIWYTV